MKIGSHHSEETKSKIRKALEGHEGYWKGRRFSEKHKEIFGGKGVGSKGNKNSWKGNDAGIAAHRARARKKVREILDKRIPKKVVHHIDGNPKNNKNDNLLVCTQKCHMLLHKEMKKMPREFQ